MPIVQDLNENETRKQYDDHVKHNTTKVDEKDNKMPPYSIV